MKMAIRCESAAENGKSHQKLVQKSIGCFHIVGLYKQPTETADLLNHF